MSSNRMSSALSEYIAECTFIGFAIEELVLSLVLCGVACIEFLIGVERGQLF